MLAHRNAELKRLLLDRIEFAARRVGWAVNGYNLVALADESFQSFFREGRLADKNDSHGSRSLVARSFRFVSNSQNLYPITL
jgi:hypothetical protein